MNEEGKTVTWQLTKGTSFAEVHHLLNSIKHHSQPIRVVYIDDCCKIRNKIHSVFGQNVSVKLDLFHATQRVTKTLCKANEQFYNCVQDLRLVFREDGDSGKKRMSHTPEPAKMMHNIDTFQNKGNSVFTAQTASAISNLKRHIQRGCLLGIPTWAGTNKMSDFTITSTHFLTEVRWEFYWHMHYSVL